MTAITVGLIIQITKESVEPQPNDPLSDIKFISPTCLPLMIIHPGPLAEVMMIAVSTMCECVK